MGGPKGPMRGRKTHRFDQKLNRGEAREPELRADERAQGEEHMSHAEEQMRDEHPTRKTQGGYKSRGGHRI